MIVCAGTTSVQVSGVGQAIQTPLDASGGRQWLIRDEHREVDRQCQNAVLLRRSEVLFQPRSHQLVMLVVGRRSIPPLCLRRARHRTPLRKNTFAIPYDHAGIFQARVTLNGRQLAIQGQ